MSEMIFETQFVNTEKNVILFYSVPLGYTNSGMARRAFATNRGIFKAVSGANYLYGVSTTVRDRSVTLTFNERGHVSGLVDNGPVTVSFS